MAHFAQIDENNIVRQVIVAGNEYEESGEALYAEIAGKIWKRTSYNTYGGVHTHGGTPFRKNYAGIGFTYDEVRDAFIPPKPYDSWILNESTCLWESLIPYPEDGNVYVWSEFPQQWTLVNVNN
jgi:hypothetical protein